MFKLCSHNVVRLQPNIHFLLLVTSFTIQKSQSDVHTWRLSCDCYKIALAIQIIFCSNSKSNWKIPSAFCWGNHPCSTVVCMTAWHIALLCATELHWCPKTINNTSMSLTVALADMNTNWSLFWPYPTKCGLIHLPKVVRNNVCD